MNKIFYLLTTTLAIFGCSQSATSGRTILSENAGYANVFTLPDAEKVLGEPAHLSDSASTVSKDVSRFSCAYSANAKDEKTGMTGVIYFLSEHYADLSAAQKKYSSIKKANENHEGIKVLNDIGDEAYFHTDGENFYFIMVRKGLTVFNMKVNKITSNTSLEQFHLIAKKITAAISK
jgi:hypothetical protein